MSIPLSLPNTTVKIRRHDSKPVPSYGARKIEVTFLFAQIPLSLPRDDSPFSTLLNGIRVAR